MRHVTPDGDTFGAWIDKNNGDVPYKGRVPRDLDVGDQYELNDRGTIKTYEITRKEVVNGSLIVESIRVGDQNGTSGI